MGKFNKIVIKDCYDWQSVIDSIPYGMDDLVNIEIVRYGFLHDCGIHVVIRRISDGKHANITEAKALFDSVLKDVLACWKLNDQYGYH